MNAYNELDGIPCGASHELLTGILRDEWGFDGYVVADYFSVRQLENYHHLAADAADAASMALAAGLDVELPMTDCYGAPLVDAVDAGIVATEILDRAVERVLRIKFELGLFECPFVDVAQAGATVGMASARRFARSLAGQSIVLLRNDGVLPIEPTTTARIAVIGPNADDPRNLFGDYSYAAHVETLLEMRDDNVFHVPIPDDLDLDLDVVGERTVFRAISAAFPTATVRTTPGCTVNGTDRDGIDDAVRLAAESDIAVMVMGDKAGLTVDSTCGEGRDRSSLDLPGVQEELLRAVIATGTPVVLVLVAGRPCGSVDAHERSAAVVAAWLPGDEGPAAIADVLSGAVNPGGKLPVSFPRTAGHIPVYYRQKRSGGRSHWKGDYVDAAVTALHPFGHGLSYTSFELTASKPTPMTIGHDGEVTIAVTVANTGARDGDEVVQLYTRDPQASLTRPVLELKAFARVSVPAGRHRTVTFTVHAGQLGFHDRQFRYVIEPGEIEVHVGTSVTELHHAGTFTIATSNGAVEVDKVFDAQIRMSDSDGAPPRKEPA
jgi:beta-glucosidase